MSHTKPERDQLVLQRSFMLLSTFILVSVITSIPALAIETKLDDINVTNSPELQNVLSENKKLANENQALMNEIQRLKSEQEAGASKMDELARQHEKVAAANRLYAQQIKKLEKNLQDNSHTQNENSETIQLAQAETSDSATVQDASAVPTNSENEDVSSDENPFVVPTNVASLPAETRNVKDRESKTLDLLSKVDAFTETDEQLKLDAARAHYNMGNIYFQKGEYEVAAREYYQAVTLMPDDADSHFNLALVSGDYLNDQKTALKHYQMYLYLKPNATDADLVREKMTHAKLTIRNSVDSPLDKKENK